MENKLVRTTSVIMLLLTGFMCAALIYLPKLHTGYHSISASRIKLFLNHSIDLRLLDNAAAHSDEMDEAGALPNRATGQLTFKMPEGTAGADIAVSEDYLYQTISLDIPGADEEYCSNIPLTGSSTNIEEITAYYTDGTCHVEINTMGLYEVSYSYDDYNFCVSLIDPHEIYDYIVVVDAGHGGRVPGTVVSGVSEKDIDLAIALKLKGLLDESDKNLGVYYTRTDDTNPDFFYRANLATASNADAFVSIHNNSLAGRGRTTTQGVQVLYDEEDPSDRSAAFAQVLLDEVVAKTGATNRGLVRGNDIYVVRTPSAPAALIEVGFMTHTQELKNLLDESYQEKVAQGIYDGIMAWLEEE